MMTKRRKILEALKMTVVVSPAIALGVLYFLNPQKSPIKESFSEKDGIAEMMDAQSVGLPTYMARSGFKTYKICYVPTHPSQLRNPSEISALSIVTAKDLNLPIDESENKLTIISPIVWESRAWQRQR